MIQVTLKAHATLKGVFGQNNLIISVPEGSNVGEVFDHAGSRFQEHLEQMYGLQRSHELLQHSIIPLNGKHHLKPDALKTKVKEGDQIEIRMLLAGG
jgi:molybdopterin converting factor small subunit